MIENFAVFFSLLSVIFVVMNKTISWPVGIVGIIFYAIYFYNLGVNANMLLQTLFLLQSIYGWYNWNKPDVSIGKLNSVDNAKVILSTYILILFFFIILNFTNSNFYIFDAITTSLSISAMYLLSNRKVESWYYWISADILYIIFFINIGSYLSAITYFIFLILAIIGLTKWYTEIKKL